MDAKTAALLKEVLIEKFNQIIDKLTEIERTEVTLRRLVKLALKRYQEEDQVLLTKQEVMDQLNITKSTYYRWVSEGVLQPRGMGEDRFLKSELKQLLEERKYRKRRRLLPRPGDTSARRGDEP